MAVEDAEGDRAHGHYSPFHFRSKRRVPCGALRRLTTANVSKVLFEVVLE